MSNSLINSTTQIDTTLTKEGYAADSKITGDKIKEISNSIGVLHGKIIAQSGESNNCSYDMSGEPAGIYMTIMLRSNYFNVLVVKSDGALEYLSDGVKTIDINGTVVTFKGISWYEIVYLFRLKV